MLFGCLFDFDSFCDLGDLLVGIVFVTVFGCCCNLCCFNFGLLYGWLGSNSVAIDLSFVIRLGFCDLCRLFATLFVLFCCLVVMLCVALVCFDCV